jgi:hypothetical protein
MASLDPTSRAHFGSCKPVDERVMSQTSARAGRCASTVSRLRWHVNRSPAARLIKRVRRSTDRRQVALRRRLAREFAVDPRICWYADLLTRDGFARVDDVCEGAALAALSAAGEAKLVRAAEAAKRRANTHKLRSHRGDVEVLGKLAEREPRAVIAPRLTAFVVETSRSQHALPAHGQPHGAGAPAAALYRELHHDSAAVSRNAAALSAARQ